MCFDIENKHLLLSLTSLTKGLPWLSVPKTAYFAYFAYQMHKRVVNFSYTNIIKLNTNKRMLKLVVYFQ